MSENINMVMPHASQPVKKKVLENGLTVLVCESHIIPKVSFQMWYNVGSKDELLSEKGIAHLIEHMIFKGTDMLSESDINTLVHKLSGSCNAFTSFDYTGYLFNFPTQHWKQALPVVADCMTNCSFKDDMLNSEMKAVIQELKMYKDQYNRSLIQEMIGMVFADHPYHYPIIGYKQDLWNVSGKDLYAFYKKHYCPNNATFIVVGDVDAQDVFDLAEKHFGTIERDFSYERKKHFFHRDIVSKSITLLRDVVQPFAAFMFVVPGSIQKQDYILEIIEYIIGKGKSSRLYKKLVNETQLATDVSTGFWNLFDYGVFFILVDPKDQSVLADIELEIAKELQDLVKNGITDLEFERAYKKTCMSFYSLLEDFEEQAYAIGQTFLATGDENYIFTALSTPIDVLKEQATKIIAQYFRSPVMHKGFVLPIPETEKSEWMSLQQESDQEDAEILTARQRLTSVEPPSYADHVIVSDPEGFAFPKAHVDTLSHGIKVFTYNNQTTPKINVAVEFKARFYVDPEDKQGLYNFVTEMMTEGTHNYTGQELADAIESRGMSLEVYPGGVMLKMLKDDFEYGLDLLREILINATFPEEEIEKIRKQLQAEIKQYWDEPRSFVGHLVRQCIYKNHPYSKLNIGTLESISAINRDDLIAFYKKYISPFQARISVVGDLGDYNVKQILENKFQDWPLAVVDDVQFPVLHPVEPQEIPYVINRDQVVLCFAQLSIDRKSPDYDAYLLFDQIFSGGVLGSMSSRLFDLREATGLFYTIKGSLITGADEQPGMFLVSTIVSRDRLEEAEKVIKHTIDTVIDTITQEELEEAKRAVINSLVDNFAANSSIGRTFLFLDKYGFSADYFDNRAQQLSTVTLEDMKAAVRKMLNSKNMITVRVGRV